MERHNVALLFLFAVIAMSFPILYQAHAQDSVVVVYQYAKAVPDERDEISNITEHQWVSTFTSENSQKETVVKVFPEVNNEVVSSHLELKEEKVAAEEEKVDQKKITTKAEMTLEPLEVQEIPKKQELQTDFEQALRSEIHTRTNTIRAHKGLATLAYDPALANIARGHSADMLNRDYLAHISPDGCDVTCRVKNASYTADYWGENIIWLEATTLPDVPEMATSFMESWMNSGGHRENILSPNYTHAGIGVTQKGGVVYVTVNFAKPK